MKISKQGSRSLGLQKIEIIMVFNQTIESDDTEYIFAKSIENFPFHLDQESSSIFVDMMCKRPLVKNNNEFYEYLINKDMWIPIVSGGLSVFQEQLRDLQLNRDNAKGCLMDDNTFMLCGGNLLNYVEWNHLPRGDLEHKLEKISSVMDRCYQKISEVDSPLSGVRYHTVTRMRTNVAMIVGGESVSKQENGEIKSIPTSRVYFISSGGISGVLTGNSMVTRIHINTARSHHVSFKMNSSIYVVGGKDAKNQLLASCERFDGHKWVISQYSLPYPVFMASVFVSKHETFAVLIGGRTYRSHGYIGHSIMHKYDDTYQHNEKSMIFTEKTGWKVIRTPSSAYFTVPSCHPLKY